MIPRKGEGGKEGSEAEKERQQVQGEGHSFTEAQLVAWGLCRISASQTELCALSEEGPLIYLPAPSCLLAFIGQSLLPPVLLFDLLAPPSSYWGTPNLGESVGVMEASPRPPPRVG